MKIEVSKQPDVEPRPEGMSITDWLKRVSWTATYHDGSLEIVVPQHYALAAVAELEQKLSVANDPTWPQV